MKKFRKIISIIVLILIISACSKTKKEELVPEPAASFSVIIDGKPFTADTAYSISNGSTLAEIIIYDEYGESMGINIYGSTPGTYAYSNNSSILYCLLKGYNHYASHMCNDRTGSLILTKFDSAKSKISGTFTFSGKEPYDTTTHIMTDGKFVNLPLKIY